MQVDLQGIRIFYQEWGQGPQTVLCFHGWGMNGDSWIPVARRFPPNQWRIIMPDLRGFGRSDKPPSGYHINDYMRDTIRLVRALRLTRVDLIGHSFGGTGALYLAARIPHLVRRLVLFDTTAGAGCALVHPRIAKQFARIQALAGRVSDSALPTLLSRIWRQSLTIAPPPDQASAQTEASRQAERHAVLATLNTVLTTDISQFLTHLKVPTLLIRGQEDPLLKDSPDGLDEIPNALRVTIPGVGHYPPIENLNAVWPYIANFLLVSE